MQLKSYIHLLVVETNQDVIESKNAGVGVCMPPGTKMSERECLVEWPVRGRGKLQEAMPVSRALIWELRDLRSYPVLLTTLIVNVLNLEK